MSHGRRAFQKAQFENDTIHKVGLVSVQRRHSTLKLVLFEFILLNIYIIYLLYFLSIFLKFLILFKTATLCIIFIYIYPFLSFIMFVIMFLACRTQSFLTTIFKLIYSVNTLEQSFFSGKSV